MWKLHRYYLKEIAINGILTFGMIFGLATVSFLYKALALLKGGGVLDAVITTILMAVDILPHLLNSSLMFATVLTFARASQDREITAARAAGISPRVLMTPALLLGLLCSTFAVWALHYEIPWAHHERFRIIASLYKGEIDVMLRGEDHFEFGDGGVMVWRRRQREAGVNNYYDVSIYARENKLAAVFPTTTGPKGNLVTARRVWFEPDDSGGVTMNCEGLFMPTSRFFLANLAIGLGADSFGGRRRRAVDVKDLQSDTLLAEVYQGVHQDPAFARFTVHRRSCFALLPFLLAPIGFCLGLLGKDRGRVLAMSLCMIPLGIVYTADFMSESLVRKTQIEWIGWSPAILIVCLGVPFCRHVLRS